MVTKFNTTTRDDGIEILDWRTASLVEALRFHAARTPDDEVYGFLGDGESVTQRITWAGLEKAACTVAAWVQRLVARGQRVLLLYDNGIDYITGLLGVLYAGCVPVSGVYPRAMGSRDRLISVLGDSGARAVIGVRKTLVDFQQACPDLEPDLIWIPADSIRPTNKEFVPFLPANDDIALVQYTSGSTRAARGVVLSHRNLLNNLHRQAIAFNYRPGDVGISWLPLSHDMGLIGGALMTLCSGGRCILMTPEDFLEKPVRWVEAISRFKATLSGAPGFAYDLCARSVTDDILASLDLTAWKIAYNGAEAISRETLRRFSSRFASAGFEDTGFYACYGLAEATLFVSSSPSGETISFGEFSRTEMGQGRVTAPSDIHDVRLVANCGSWNPEDQSLLIVDPQTGTECQTGAIGEIWLQGASVATGYLNRDAETMTQFNALSADHEGKFLRTGDLGFVLDHQLYVTGRLDNRITLDDTLIDPEDVASCVERISAHIRPGTTAVYTQSQGGADYLHIATELVVGSYDDSDTIAQRMLTELAATHKIYKLVVYFLRAGSVLRTPSGKIRISATQNAIRDGGISVVKQLVVERDREPAVKLLGVVGTSL